MEKHQPFVGNARARFRQGESIVELDAPHLDFTMELRYLSTALQKAFNQQSSSEKMEQERRQASKL